MSPPWMPLYVADYLADTGHLSTAEHGAYLLLIMHYWTKGSLPDDDGKLSRICRMTAEEWQRSRETLADLFDAEWVHGRIDRELAASAAKYERRSAAGSKGGKAKAAAKQNPSNASRELEANGNPGSTNHNHTILADSSEPNGSGGKPPADEPQWPTDPIERVWTEGQHLMRCMGVGDRESRSNIGRWMGETGNRADDVLAAIRRARDMGTRDPIPLVGRTLNPVNGSRHGNRSRQPEPAKADRRVASMARVLGLGDEQELPADDPSRQGADVASAERGCGDAGGLRSIPGGGDTTRDWRGGHAPPRRLSG